MPFHPYDAARLAAVALVQRMIARTGLKLSEDAREALEHAVSDDLIRKPIADQGTDHPDGPSGSGIYPSAQTADIVALSDDAVGRPH